MVVLRKEVPVPLFKSLPVGSRFTVKFGDNRDNIIWEKLKENKARGCGSQPGQGSKLRDISTKYRGELIDVSDIEEVTLSSDQALTA